MSTKFDICPSEFARNHSYFNKKTKQFLPARCKCWSCYSCAIVNYYKIDHQATLGNPTRFITLTRAGNTSKDISLNFQHLIQAVRREYGPIEYFAVPELHSNGQAHLHILTRGPYIHQKWLSKKWEVFTAKSYGGSGSFVVDIRKIQDNQNVKGYLLKYLKKSWDDNGPKSWLALQAKYPGLRHYRKSKNWAEIEQVKDTNWQLLKNSQLELAIADKTPPGIELFFEVARKSERYHLPPVFTPPRKMSNLPPKKVLKIILELPDFIDTAPISDYELLYGQGRLALSGKAR